MSQLFLSLHHRIQINLLHFMSLHYYQADRPAEIDSLGRSQFASSLAHALLVASPSDGFVIGVEGGWGTGKSSIISFAKNSLSGMDPNGANPIIVEFNPWLVSNTGALVEALIGQIAAAINAGVDSTQQGIQTGEKLLRYAGLLRHFKHLKYVPGVSWAGNIAEGISVAADSIESAAKGTQEVLDEVKQLLPALDLSKRKSEVAEALRELDRTIVVILDDIDRLPSDEIRVVVQAIKAVADFPRTTYLLAYDRDVVARALGQGEVSAGLAYLEKIVQVAYPIPPLFQYQLRKFVATKTEALLAALEIELKEFEQNRFDSAISLVTMLARHPRDVVRLINRLMLSIPATYREVNLVDVLVFEAMSQRYPSIREMVHTNPEDFIGHPFRGDIDDFDPFSWLDWAEVQEEERKGPVWEKHLPLGDPDRKIAARVLEFLFGADSREKDEVPEDQLRMADPDRLARYFRMSSLENVPEAADIHHMLHNSESLTVALMDADEKEMQFHLEWLSNYLPSCERLNASGSIKALIGAASERSKGGQLTEPIINGFEKLVEQLLRLIPMSERRKLFSTVVESAPLSIAEHVLLRATAELGMWEIRPEMRRENKDRLIDDWMMVKSATKIWSNRVLEAFHAGALSREDNLHSILYRYAQLNYRYADTFEMVRKICESDDGLAKFISRYDEESHLSVVDQFGLIENAVDFAERIKSSPLKTSYAWLTTLLSNDSNARKLSENAETLKAKMPPIST